MDEAALKIGEIHPDIRIVIFNPDNHARIEDNDSNIWMKFFRAASSIDIFAAKEYFPLVI